LPARTSRSRGLFISESQQTGGLPSHVESSASPHSLLHFQFPSAKTRPRFLGFHSLRYEGCFMAVTPDGGVPICTYDDFLKVDIRVGRIVDVQPFPEARKPAFKLIIDFGPAIGHKKSSAQITQHYKPHELIGRQVAAVVNFPPRQIGPFMSEVLTLGFPDALGAVVLFRPDLEVPLGGRLF
jgi:tRNA-binding protein